MPKRLGVLKTFKLYLGGKFPRTESGRYIQVTNPKTGEHLANYCHASKKDLRDAIRAARSALPGWARDSSPYLRGQILYRAAEMLEGKRSDMTGLLCDSTGCSKLDADQEISAAIDHLVYFAGWTDKYQQVFGSVNPVASPHFNFSVPDPSGVTVVFCPDTPPLAGLIGSIAPVILSGNCCTAVVSGEGSLAAITFAESLATSDLPDGVINILTGSRQELAPHASSHMDVNAIVDCSADPAIRTQLQTSRATNLKRVSFRNYDRDGWIGESSRDPYAILETVEIKTTWHPIGS